MDEQVAYAPGSDLYFPLFFFFIASKANFTTGFVVLSVMLGLYLKIKSSAIEKKNQFFEANGRFMFLDSKYDGWHYVVHLRDVCLRLNR